MKSIDTIWQQPTIAATTPLPGEEGNMTDLINIALTTQQLANLWAGKVVAVNIEDIEKDAHTVVRETDEINAPTIVVVKPHSDHIPAAPPVSTQRPSTSTPIF